MFPVDKEALQKQTGFGRDFLTYICYKSDKNAGVFAISSPDKQFSLWVDGKIVLEDDRESAPNAVSFSGDDFTSQDLKQAIQTGKKVKEARVRIEKGENTWCFTLRADSYAVSGLKIDMPRAEDSDEQFFGRMFSIEALNTIIDSLYIDFITEITAKAWKSKGYREFQQWLQAS